jgi:hypothetical protein
MKRRRQIDRQPSSQCAGAKFSTAPKCLTTALFTRMSSPLCRCCAISISSGICASCRRSAPWYWARTPKTCSSANRASITSAEAKPFRVMSQPKPASAFAVAKPIPQSDPVIRADLLAAIASFPLSSRRPYCSWKGRQGMGYLASKQEPREPWHCSTARLASLPGRRPA